MGGIGEYYDTDPVLIRLVFLLITLITGLVPGVLAYLLALLIVPEAPITASAKPVEPEVVHDAEAV